MNTFSETWHNNLNNMSESFLIKRLLHDRIDEDDEIIDVVSTEDPFSGRFR